MIINQPVHYLVDLIVLNTILEISMNTNSVEAWA